MQRSPAALVVSPLFVLASVVFLLLPRGTARADDPPPEEASLLAAVGAFEAADYKRSIEIADAVADDHADAPRARYLAGEAWLVLGDASKAEAAFQAVLEKKPDAVPAKIGLARAQGALGKADEAEKALRAVVEAEPASIDARRALGEVLLAAGRTEDAEKILAAVYKEAPKDPFVARAYAEARVRSGDLKQGATIGSKLAKALPKHPMGPFLQALSLEKLKKDDEAIAAYEEAIQRDDRFLDAHKNLAILCHTMSSTYSNAARTEKAKKHYEKYFALGGADPELRKMYDTLKGFFASR
jgi:tetratricopeptide (TPR) repeat protein